MFKKARRDINNKFNIKEWHYLEQSQTLTYLGMQWTRGEDSITVQMDTHSRNLPSRPVASGNDQDLLDEAGVHDDKSLIMKVRWPVSHVMPALAYRMRALSQG